MKCEACRRKVTKFTPSQLQFPRCCIIACFTSFYPRKFHCSQLLLMRSPSQLNPYLFDLLFGLPIPLFPGIFLFNQTLAVFDIYPLDMSNSSQSQHLNPVYQCPLTSNSILYLFILYFIPSCHLNGRQKAK